MRHSIPRNVWMVDTTLRDGLQAPGFILSDDDKTRLAIALDALGVPELEIGLPDAVDAQSSWVAGLVRRKLSARLCCWCRANAMDIEKAFRCGVRAAHLSFPLSDRLLRAFHKDRAWLFQTLKELVPFAGERFHYISIGMQDAARADRAVLADFVEAVAGLDVQRIRAADSVGILTPMETVGLIDFVRRRAGELEVDFHGHNDLGMATANTVAAVEAGATCVNVTVNGIGERAGNARLEEVAVALSLGLGLFNGLDETRLNHISRLVATMSGRSLPVDKPISGDHIFTHESGIHGAAQLRDTLAYQPFPPGRVGRCKPSLRAGNLTGKNILAHMLRAEGIQLPAAHMDAFTAFVRQEAQDRQHAFDRGEIRELWRQFSENTPIAGQVCGVNSEASTQAVKSEFEAS